MNCDPWSLLKISGCLAEIQRERPQPRLLAHSDRGMQYASDHFQQRLAQCGIRGSMSRKANCWDNAPTESPFATIKKELVHQTTFATREAARQGLGSVQRSRQWVLPGTEDQVQFCNGPTQSIYQWSSDGSMRLANLRLSEESVPSKPDQRKAVESCFLFESDDCLVHRNKKHRLRWR